MSEWWAGDVPPSMIEELEMSEGGPMTTRYYEETPCPHGQMNSHNAIRLPSGEVIDDEPCPGGQRRELTGVEVGPGVYASGAISIIQGRYVIIPLELED